MMWPCRLTPELKPTYVVEEKAWQASYAMLLKLRSKFGLNELLERAPGC